MHATLKMEPDPGKSARVSYKELISSASPDSNLCLIRPRDYQQTLIDYAISRNSIVYLGTGLGKTLIAIYVIKHLFGESPEVNKLYQLPATPAKNSAKVFFVVKTRNLVRQQGKSVDKLTGLRVGQYHCMYRC